MTLVVRCRGTTLRGLLQPHLPASSSLHDHAPARLVRYLIVYSSVSLYMIPYVFKSQHMGSMLLRRRCSISLRFWAKFGLNFLKSIIPTQGMRRHWLWRGTCTVGLHRTHLKLCITCWLVYSLLRGHLYSCS